MRKFIVERTVPGAGNLTPADLSEIAKKSQAAMNDLGKPYHWVQTYVVRDKLFCVHVAQDEETVRKHSALGCFPVDQVYEVVDIIDASNAK